MTIEEMREILNSKGELYHDYKNNSALTFKTKKNKLVWKQEETYKQFLQRCIDNL
jgi:hypothetical protein